MLRLSCPGLSKPDKLKFTTAVNFLKKKRKKKKKKKEW